MLSCRHCQSALHEVFIDLGSAPPSNAFLRAEDLNRPELYFPLKVFTCQACGLVQVDELQGHEALFSSDYVYFSSISSSWVEHARRHVERSVERLGLGPGSLVLEIASNDGYLLQHVKARGIPCLGIEPTHSTAQAARARGIESIEQFFGREFAQRLALERGHADWIVGNNVLAHVPDINDFVAGLKAALAPGGCITLEFPHLQQLVEQAQFDTIYHEHFSYLGFATVRRILAAQGLAVWDVEQLPSHGGSLRVWAGHAESSPAELPSVGALLAQEVAAGMEEPAFYRRLQARADAIKHQLLRFLLEQKAAGKTVLAYGAAAKGCTLLNYAGLRPDLLAAVADASPHKQGRFLPGSRIPVLSPEQLLAARPDFVLLLPWNLRAELEAQLAAIRGWGGQFVVAVPELQVF